MALPPAGIGDLVVMFCAGAYGLTASPTAFLGPPGARRSARLTPRKEPRMEPTTTATDVEAVKAVLVETLGLEDRAATIDASTPLLGSLPELDSLAVMELVLALEERFGITVEGEDVTAEAFETLTSLTAFVDEKR